MNDLYKNLEEIKASPMFMIEMVQMKSGADYSTAYRFVMEISTRSYSVNSIVCERKFNEVRDRYFGNDDEMLDLADGMEVYADLSACAGN